MKRNLLFILCLTISSIVLLVGVFSAHTPVVVSSGALPASVPVINFVSVSVGSGHTCGLTDRGGVMCWGANTNGQLGDGTTTDRYTPVYVKGLTSGVKAVSAGSTHTCALLMTGGVKCWGNNNRGQLGDGTNVNRWTPVAVIGMASGVASIEAGGLDTCAVTIGGGAKCWGSNNQGRLGDGTITDRWTPVDVAGLSSGVARIRTNDAGGAHTCAVSTNGSLKCWGGNASGQLGNGTTSASYTPIDVSGMSSGVSDVALGTWHTCAATSSGVKCWGDDSLGQLGDAMTTTQTTPVGVIGLESGALSVTTGRDHSCALLSGSEIKCWGSNFSGELGDGTTIGRLTPTDVISLTGSVTMISAGGEHSCALLTNGGIDCWGDNYAGQLGNGLAINHTTPTDVTGFSSGVTDVALGDYHVCALQNGGVQCWGDNGFGQLGAGAAVTQTPVNVSGLISDVVSINAGALHTCALTDSGAVQCWGDNRSGQLGDGTINTQYTPITVTGLMSGVMSIGAGGYHTCALTDQGGVKCWGANYVGACNENTSLTPVDVCGLTSGVSAISVGYDHTCALTVGGGVKCWGANGSGQLGDGTTTPQPTPTDVISLTTGVKAISAGLVDTCAVLQDDTVKCWGNNATGQLSDGTLSHIHAISVGNLHACSITNNGSLLCWGSNQYGQLGDGTLNNSAAPRGVIGLSSGVSAVTAGYEHTCAVVNSGLKCWGNNEYNMLGDGSLPYSPIPVEVVRPSEWHIFLPLINRPAYNPSFRANFTAQPVSGLAPLEVSFTNTSTGTYTSLLWDFGDGSTDTLPNPSHIYWSIGAYNPTLFLSDGVVTATKSITIDVLPAQELIINGGFEQGQFAWQWSEYPDHARVVTDVVHSGQYAAKLGIDPSQPLVYSYASATYSQGYLPNTPHVRLSFWYWPRREGLAGDPTRSRQFAYVTDTGGHILQKLFEFDENLPDWQYAEFDLSQFAGQSILIQFGVYHDGNAVYDKRSLLYVDDVSLQIDAMPPSVDQLAAYYPFNGDAHDASGNGNDGVVYGATLTTDRFGNPDSAYQFNGSSAYISVTYSNSLSFRQDMTVAAWVKTTDDAGGIAQQQNGGTDGNFIFDISSGGRLRFGRSALLVWGGYNSQVVNDNRWHLVVGVFNPTQTQVRQYVDGLLVLTYTDFSYAPDDHIPLIIGNDNDHLSPLNGAIDDVRLYNRALSDAEIAALWAAR
jgi:alpha-tubulin suppressor-like RCC1 family protein/PKD repeat protein